VTWRVAIAGIAIALVARVAAADPALPRVLTAPTAWLPAAGTLVGSAGLDHRGAGSLVLSYGLGDLAAIELGADSDLRECTAPAGASLACTPVLEAHAAFRIGARQDTWFAGQPALALAVETELGASRASSATLVGSRVIGPVRVHAGAMVLDARVPLADGSGGDVRLGPTLRPTAGLELTPPTYPKTTLLGDLAWEPRFEPTRPATEWLAGWGVRYQALHWSSIELDVRHREGEGLAGSTVLVRVNGVFPL
jgi:hypothetical protein